MAAEKPTVTKLSGTWDTALLLKHIHDGINASTHNWTLTNVDSVGVGDDAFTASPNGKSWEINFAKDATSAGAFKVAIAPDGGITNSIPLTPAWPAGTISVEKLCEPVAGFSASTATEVICMVFSDMVCVLFQTSGADAYPCLLIIGQVVNIFSADLAASPNFVDGTGLFFGQPYVNYNNASSSYGHSFIATYTTSGTKAVRQFRVGENVWIGDNTGDVSINAGYHSQHQYAVNSRWLMNPVLFGVEGNSSNTDWAYYKPNAIGLLNHFGMARTAGNYSFYAKDRVYMDDGVEWLFVYMATGLRNYGQNGLFITWDDTVAP